MVTPRSSDSSSDGASSSNTKSAIVAAAVIVPICVFGLGFMWCFLWRRRNKQLRGDKEDRQRELESMHPNPSETLTATTEFQWPSRIGNASTRLEQLQQAQEKPEKEVFVVPAGSMPYQQQQQHQQQHPSTPPPVAQKVDYHHHPLQQQQQQYTCQNCQHHDHQNEIKLKYMALGPHQQEPAELPHQHIPELQSRVPQELPGPTPPPIFPHELEGHLNTQVPADRSRFVY